MAKTAAGKAANPAKTPKIDNAPVNPDQDPAKRVRGKMIAGYIDREQHEDFALIASLEHTTMQELLAVAIADLLSKAEYRRYDSLLREHREARRGSPKAAT